jgi:hypothetical protein
MFEDATFHSSGILPDQTPKWMLLTFAVNLTTAAALIVLPLIYPGALPTHIFQSILYTPPTEPVVVKPQILTQAAIQSTQPDVNPYRSPIITPATTYTGPVDPPPGAIANLISDTERISGSASPSTSIFPRSTPVVVKSASTHPMAVSTGVSDGMILY